MRLPHIPIVRRPTTSFSRQAPSQSQNRFQPNYQNRNADKSKNYAQISKNEKRKRLMHLLCSHCSRHAGTNKYHHGPFGGGENSKCPYDSRGILRAGYKFIAGIFGESVNALNIPDLQEIEAEGLSYETPNVSSVEPGQKLLSDALGPFYSNE